MYLEEYYTNTAQILSCKLLCVTPQSNKALLLKERLSLLNKLEKAEAKAQTLEAQVKVQKRERYSGTVFHRLGDSLMSLSLMISNWVLCLCLRVLQLEENATLWGQQKQEMLSKLCKHRHVFDCTSTTTFRDVPSLS